MSQRSTRGGPDVPLFDLRLEQEDLDSVAEVLRSGRLAMGERTARFEAAFARHLGSGHAVAVCSGTAALHLAYLGVGVGAGDEVIVPATTFVATANAAIYCGATPVIVDVMGTDDFGIDPDEVLRNISPRTRAVCAVHYGGYAAAVDRLAVICADHGMTLIEDAAHSPCASLEGRALGTWGATAAFSFFSNKVLSVGEGGLVAVADGQTADRVRRWRSSDRDRCADSGSEPCFNYALDEPRAALLLSRLERMPTEVSTRRALTMRYRQSLAGLDGVTVPYTDAQVMASSCYVMPVVLEDPARQTAVRSHMLSCHGVQTSVLYPALHEFSAYRERFGPRHLPRAERIARAQLTLPLYPHMTKSDQGRVLDALESALRA
jgi:dTDP-4-amino-4,6-dideoxygalactose transaminase